MDVYIHFKSLPQDKTLDEIENGLFDAMDGKGIVNGGSFDGTGGHIELELQDEDDNVNPKYAQLGVKAYLQQMQFPKDTLIEFGGMEIPLYN